MNSLRLDTPPPGMALMLQNLAVRHRLSFTPGELTLIAHVFAGMAHQHTQHLQGIHMEHFTLSALRLLRKAGVTVGALESTQRLYGDLVTQRYGQGVTRE